MDPTIPPTSRRRDDPRSERTYPNPSHAYNPNPNPNHNPQYNTNPNTSHPIAGPSTSTSTSARPSERDERRDVSDRDRARSRAAEGNGVPSQAQGSGQGQGQESQRESQRERIGDYYLGNEIGRGSFATVFKGYRVKTRHPIAIKAVSRSKLTPKLLENLEGEINILKAIEHRRVVELEDCIKNDHHIYLIMAFCSGGDLSIYIKKRGRLPTLDYYPFEGAKEKVFWPHPKEGGLDGRVARCFLGQLADALQFLRARNLIHRDIKPQNLLLHPASEQDYANGHPLGIPLLKVADFGFARILPAATLAETLCGSPLYMAPEILRYEKYDAKADLWSVGAVLFETVVGRPPFRAQNHVELLRKIEKGEDRIKFPDERSARDIEAAAAEQPQSAEVVPVAEDVKALIRKLLKRVPVQRMSFEDFFSCGVWDGYMTVAVPKATLEESRPQVQRNASSSGSAGPSASNSPRITPMMQRQGSQSKHVTSSPQLAPTDPTILPSPRMAHASPIEIRSRTSSDVGRTSQESFPATNPIERPSVPKRYSTMGQRPPTMRDTRTPELGTPPTHDGIAMSKDKQALSRLSTSPGSGGLTMSSRRDVPVLASQAGLQDSMLGEQYVVVEKRNVEVNAMADELETVARRPDGLARRRSSRLSALTRPMVSMTSGPGNPGPSSSSPVSYSPPFTLSSTPPFAIVAGAHQRKPSLQSLGSSPGISTRARPILVPHAATTYGMSMTYQQAAQEARYPDSPPAGAAHSLARAISYAGNMKLFGSPLNAIGSFSRKPWLRSRQIPSQREDDLGEEDVLQDLEDLSQKAFALSEMANAKLAICLNAPKLATSSGGMASENLMTGQSPSLSMAAAYPYQGNLAARRRSSSASISSSDLTAARLEILCAEALVLHLKALAFLQAGVEKAKLFWDQKAMMTEVVQSSPEFNETVQWFRNKFNDSFDRAEWAKSRCPEELPETASYVEKLVYDKAIELSRSAAVTELVGDDLYAAEAGYENALWLLQAVLDSIMYDGQEVGDSDKVMIEKVIVSIRVRVDTLRRKIALIQSASTAAVHD